MFAIGLRRAVGRLAYLLPAAMLVLLAPASAAEPHIERTAAPGWIEWLAPPPVNPDRVRAAEDGIYNLLFDTQTRIVDAQPTTFRRQVVKVIERAGLEKAAQTEINFDPSFERLKINRAAIWRDGRMIDRSASVAVDILRREKALDDGIMTGERTAVVRLDDVRVGDLVDFAWTWQSVSSPWPGQYFSQPDLAWSVPMGMTRFRLIAPAAKPIAIRQSRGVPVPTVISANNLVERDWRVVDADPIPGSSHAPRWWRGWPHLDISTMTGWREVADLGIRQFANDQHLPDDYARQVNAIAAAHPGAGARAIAALRLVQDSIRYTSLSIGNGGYVPRPPAEVIRRGFGDCKDKSQLLVVTLRRLGIAAWPALTHSDEGPGLIEQLPGAGLFDHVIVLASIDGHDHWFDATASHQGGTLATLAALPYGYALPLRPGQARLVAIPNPTPAAHTMTAVETYSHVKGGLTLDVETIFSGDEADIKRHDLATSGIAKEEDDDLDYYRGMYPGLVAAKPITLGDDRDANRLIVREAYLLPETASDYGKTVAKLHILASSLRGLYKSIDDAGNRKAPIAMPWTIRRAHRIVFDMPGAGIRLPSLEDSHGPAFDLEARAWHDGDKAILDFSLKGKAPILPASAAEEYARQVDALDDVTNWSIDTTSTASGLLDNRAVAPTAAVLLILGFIGLGALRRRKERLATLRSDPLTQIVVRHVPLTGRRAA